MRKLIARFIKWLIAWLDEEEKLICPKCGPRCKCEFENMGIGFTNKVLYIHRKCKTGVEV